MTNMDSEIRVVKRDENKEIFDVTKITKILKWACECIEDVNAEHVFYNAKLNIFDGIKSSGIHQILIDSAESLIDAEVNYSKVASRLLLYKMRKEVWGGKNPPKLYDLLKGGIEKGYYDGDLLKSYTKSQVNKIDEYIKHDRDMMFEHGGLVQLKEKYLVQNRSTGELWETPQFAYALVAMSLCVNEKPRQRLKWVKEFYNDFSLHKINLSTPIMAGARTRTRSYSSCCIIEVDDNKGSLFAAQTSSGMVTCDKYGVGLDLTKLRSINEPIRGGETLHTGVVPWLKIYQDTIQSCQQGGARRGAATVTFSIFHPQIETILQLKDNLLTEERKVEYLDYSIATCNLFWKRLISGGEITLCSYNQAPEVYDAFGKPEFNDIYEQWERENPDAPKVSAEQLHSLLAKQRSETARIYIYNIDEATKSSSWVNPCGASNLCQEVFGDTIPERFSNDPLAETVVCILSAGNMLRIEDHEDHRRVIRNIVRMLDNIIEIQEYTVSACERYAKNKRSLGVGVSNLAGWLAEKGYNHHSEETPQLINDYLERQQYYLIEASVDLAKERGICEHFERSKYSQGVMPIDRYNKNVDDFVNPDLHLDWEGLRALVIENGMRHCTLSAFMPCESSSIIQSSTSGFEPVRDLISYKPSKTKTTVVVVPNYKTHKQNYVRAYDAPDNSGYIKTVAVLTKWADMGVSGNLYYNPANWDGGIIPQSVILQDILTATKLGWCTFYYHNTDDGNKEEEAGCAGGACSL